MEARFVDGQQKKGKISSLIRLPNDDCAFNEGQYRTNRMNKQEDNIWNFAATNSKHSVETGTKGLEGLSNDFATDHAPSTASDFVHITNAGMEIFSCDHGPSVNKRLLSVSHHLREIPG